jgi:hypothetical protein
MDQPPFWSQNALANSYTGIAISWGFPGSGGNPGAMLQITLGPPTVAGGEIWNRTWPSVPPVVWDPATQGGIGSINFSLDAMLLIGDRNNAPAGQEFALLAMQGSAIFATPFVGVNSSSWQTFTQSGLTVVDFTATAMTSGTIDFTAAGSPIAFGLIQHHSQVDPLAPSWFTVANYDNFQLDVFPVPEPGSACLTLLGLAVLGWRSRRR